MALVNCQFSFLPGLFFILHLVKASNDIKSKGCKFFHVFSPEHPPGFSWSVAAPTCVSGSYWGFGQCYVPVHSCTHANAHSQKWNRRHPGPTGANQSLHLPAEARYKMSSHSNIAIQSLTLVICSICKGLCHFHFYPHNNSVLTKE